MSCIDYGVMLKVNGVFINKNQDFAMEKSDTGYMCEKAFSKFSNDYLQVQDNFFIYAGDNQFLVCIYKSLIVFISDEKVLNYVWSSPFKTQTLFFDNLPSVTITKLDNDGYMDTLFSFDENIYCYKSEKEYKKIKLKWAKTLHQRNKRKNFWFKRDTQRWLATWEHNNNKYEVIFGYGVDNCKDIWEEIKDNSYHFTEKEKRIINEWFNNG